MGGRGIALEGVGAPSRDRRALTAFLFLVLLGGANPVAVRFSNLELPPSWGASFRFAATALIFWVLMLARRMPLPRGRALVGALLYGVLSVGVSCAFLYWGLLRVTAGMTMVVLALVPLLTQFLAWAHGLESLRWRGVLGTVMAFIGILIGVREGLGPSAPVASILSLVAGAVCVAEGSIVYKLFPENEPLTTNALAVTTGGILLAGISLIAGLAAIGMKSPAPEVIIVPLEIIPSDVLIE